MPLLNALGIAGLVWFFSNLLMLITSSQRNNSQEQSAIALLALIPAFFTFLAVI